ncbi:ribosome maturation factor RimP [Zavarzinia sp. CC-PAN008]|uniref:ribosome maturation factor RimP n=1 Tax=Zavarzinia sp. CC-PAN008 TaxID=3243332 RepID=UPI003F743D8E
MDAAARIADLIAPSVEAMGFVLVRVRLGAGRRPVLQIMAERPDGTMNVEDCADLSRAVSAILDVEDPITGEYTLEVSSPGIDRPLIKADDYVRFAGFDAKVETAVPHETRKRFRGRLLGLDAEGTRIRIQDGPTVFEVPLRLVREARLLLTDELIEASLKGRLPGVLKGAEAQSTDSRDDGSAPPSPIAFTEPSGT